jgi:hypothetical protein
MVENRVPGEGVLELSVWGIDSTGKTFSGTVRARALSLTRALLEGVPCVLAVGEIIGVRHEGRKSRFRVTWVGQSGTAQQVRIENLEPENQLWSVNLIALPEKPPSDLARTIRDTTGTAANRTERRHLRHRCSGGVRIRSGATTASWAALKDLGVGGCYIETAATLPTKTRVNLQISTERLQFQAVGVVKSSHPGYGMGIVFVGMAEDAKKNLERWNASYSAK